MNTAPTNWDNIINSDDDYYYDVKVNLAGLDFAADRIMSLSINEKGVPEKQTAAIGGAISGEIDCTFKISSTTMTAPGDADGGTFDPWNTGDSLDGGTFDPWNTDASISGGTFDIYVPIMAKVIPYVRVKKYDGSLTSGWVKKGEYFIDTREHDKKTQFFTIHGYDAMLKTEQSYVASVSTGPLTTAQVTQEIATLIGVSVESTTLTTLQTTPYDVPYFAGKYSAREMLQYIGVAYCGNFIINYDGKLKLLLMNDRSSDIISLGDKAQQLVQGDNTNQYYTSVRLNVDSNTYYVYDTGAVGQQLVEDCPFATQTMAYNLMQAMFDYVRYRQFEATDVMITPLFELGDVIHFGTIYGRIYKADRTFNGFMPSDIASEASDEINHEYEFKSPTERKLDRLSNEVGQAVPSSDFTGNSIVALINQSSTTAGILASRIIFAGSTLSLTGIESYYESVRRLRVATDADGDGELIFSNAEGVAQITLNGSDGTGTFVGNVTAPNIGTSKASLKRDIKPVSKVWDIIQNTDIYSYHLNTDRRRAPYRYGAVIGENYKCANEIIMEDREGVNLYSMCSILWKAVQDLKAEMETLKGDK